MKAFSLALPALRVSAGLLLCAACFQSGRWYQELEAQAAAPVPAARAAVVGPVITPSDIEAKAVEEPLPGEGGDIITPLNVRDPSALVMGPAHYQSACPPPPVAPSPAPMARRTKPRDMKEGRLLELLKKDDKKIVVPEQY